MLLTHEFDSAGKVAVCKIVGGRGIAAYHTLQLPLSAAESALLHQLALRGLKGLLAFLHHSGTQFGSVLSQSVAILAYHHKHSVFGYGGDIDPRGIFQHIKFRIQLSVGQFQTVAAHGEPGAPEKIFRRKHLRLALRRSGFGSIVEFVFHIRLD